MGIIGQYYAEQAFSQSAKEIAAKALEDWGGDVEKAREALEEASRELARQHIATLPDIPDDQPF